MRKKGKLKCDRLNFLVCSTIDRLKRKKQKLNDKKKPNGTNVFVQTRVEWNLENETCT